MDRGVFRCTDTNEYCAGHPLAWARFGAFAAGAAPPHVVLAITQSLYHGVELTWIATTDGVFRSAAGGNWELVHGGDGYVFSDVVVDPNCPTMIYAGIGSLG